MATILCEVNIFLSGGSKMATCSQSRVEKLTVAYQNEKAELKYAFLPPFSPNYWFQSLPSTKVKRLLSTLTKGFRKRTHILICLQIQFPRVFLPQPSTESSETLPVICLSSHWVLRLHSFHTVHSWYNMHAAFSEIQEDYIQMPPHRSDHINSDLSILSCGCCFASGIIITIPHLSYPLTLPHLENCSNTA